MNQEPVLKKGYISQIEKWIKDNKPGVANIGNIAKVINPDKRKDGGPLSTTAKRKHVKGETRKNNK